MFVTAVCVFLLICLIRSLCRDYHISQGNDMHLGTNPEPVMSSITSRLKSCTVFIRFTKRVMQVMQKYICAS